MLKGKTERGTDGQQVQKVRTEVIEKNSSTSRHKNRGLSALCEQFSDCGRETVLG